MTLIYDDKVEERRLELCVWIRFIVFRRHKLLVKSHIYLVGRIHLAVLDFGHLAFEWTEVLRHSLVDEDIAVGKIKHFLFCSGFGKAMDDLE